VILILDKKKTLVIVFFLVSDPKGFYIKDIKSINILCCHVCKLFMHLLH